MAGLSLAYYLSRSSLRNSSILLVDQEPKTKNDRTWCYWEDESGPFEDIVFRTWQHVDFYGTTFSGPLQLGGYQYKMLRGIDFYQFMQRELGKLPNLHLHYGTITAMQEVEAGAQLTVGDKQFRGNVLFDSTYRLNQVSPQNHNLLQHFKGWVITTEQPCFDPARPRVMDFRVAQEGDCRFLYVMPFDEHTALVEYTIFSEHLLAAEAYEESLRAYIGQYLCTGEYSIRETEWGVIPMSDVPTSENPSQHIVRIGTSGGHTKPSTGYTFQRTQRYLRELVAQLEATGLPPARHKPLFVTWFKAQLDSVLLNVLQKNRHPADDVFTKLFAKNPAHLVFKFMDEDTSVWEDLRVANTMPKVPFTLAVFDLIRRAVTRPGLPNGAQTREQNAASISLPAAR